MRILLNDGWQVCDFPLTYGREKHDAVLRTENGWMDCAIPCDVTVPLIQAGRALEPTVADNFEKNHWIEKKSWWFRKYFDSEEIEGWQDADSVELCFNSLDLVADVFVNGVWIASQKSAHFAFRHEIREYLVQGQNVLTVRLTVGLETVSDDDLAELNWASCTEGTRSVDARGDMRRAFLRKPQFVFGWDWSPRIATCGIMDDVYIDVHKVAAIRDVSVHTQAILDHEAVLVGEVEVENLSPFRTYDADILLTVSLRNATVHEIRLDDTLLCSGMNYIPFEIHLRNPQLWWPNGMGEQTLYRLEATLSCEGHVASHPAVQFGVRTVTLDCSRLDEKCRQFAFFVNGIKIFMKGGDWVPPDPLYARITPEKLQTLVREAANANFNAFRIWGGGIYNRDIFYNLCDEYGILLWHDFMFACSTYPDHLEWYRELCRRELEYQTRRLRNHPCIALFCGNNENHEIFDADVNKGWGLDFAHDRQYGLYTSNVMAREIVHRNCPYIPYWNSSPYGGVLPQSQEVGDVHYWGNAMMNPDMARRIDPFVYDEVTARFVSEYGYVGPTSVASIREYLGDNPLERGSRIWRLHNNTFELNTVEAGIRKHYTDETLSTEKYLLYAGLVQGTLLGYSLEAFRAKTYCCGGIFWMYDDCWGEVGWTIIDYYLRRKISYYAVKRAFEPVKLMLRREGNQVVLTAVNESLRDMEIDAEVGVVAYDGSRRDTAPLRITMPKLSREIVARFALPEYDAASACFAVIPQEKTVQPAVLRVSDARQLRLAGFVRVLRDERIGDDRRLTVRADTYTHAVYWNTDCPCSDSYFDLLPDEERTVTIYGAKDAELKPEWVF